MSLKRIVLEISEGNYKGDFAQLDHLLQYYRTYGIKVAIAGIDNDTNYFERIGKLNPEIIKINLQALKSNATASSFTDVLFSLSLLARKIGATLLFENIEMSYQLQFAWKNGGRYYQGFYLHPPAPDFIERELLKERLKGKFHEFIAYEKRKLEAIYSAAAYFQNKVQDILVKNKKANYEELFTSLAKEMDGIAFRMYVCDEDGFQKSSNILKGENGWFTQKNIF